MKEKTASRIAVFDPDAFYPFRSLVKGPFTTIDDLLDIERFVRAIVLHEQMVMMIAPFPDPKHEEELSEPGPRNVIVGFGPDLSDYEGLLSFPYGPSKEPSVDISDRLKGLASELSQAGPGNVYYKAHIEFFQRLSEVWDGGGSVICCGRVARAAEREAVRFPEQLFRGLDEDWQDYARAADMGELGPIIPPILGIVLSRCHNREEIPIVLIELREEWAEARRKVWESIDRLRASSTLKEANKIRRQLEEASSYFSPTREAYFSSPLRVLWDLFAEAGGGAVDAAFAGGDPVIGAGAASARAMLSASMRGGREFSQLLFGRGAFDLARRVRRETMNLAPTAALLSRLLTNSEKTQLGAFKAF